MPALRDYPQCGKCGCKALHEAGVGCHGVNAHTGIDCTCRGWLSASPSNYDNRISGVTGTVPIPWKPSEEYQKKVDQWKMELKQSPELPTARGTVASIIERMERRYAPSITPLRNDGAAPTSSSSNVVPTKSVSQLAPPQVAQACWCGVPSRFRNGWCGSCRR
jgi:hypothetical protein